MDATSVRLRSGGTVAVEAGSLDALRTAIGGGLLTPASPGYDEARAVWNGMIDRRPALIARCRDAREVSRAVRFASEHDLLVAIRGGGHNIAGNGSCDGGLLIDLGAMRTVSVDPARRSARAGGGATLGDVDAATQAHGLAVPLGINSTTGVAGLTLGGGFGWLSRRFGLTIDNLANAEVVTAAGEIVTASASENRELFWAIRGGGGNFGVVTAFEFDLHPVGPQVLSGLVVHPLAEARNVLRFYREFMRDAPDELACWFVLRLAPPLPFLDPSWHGRGILALAMCYSGAIAEGERVAAPLRAVGHPLADVVAPHPFTAWQQILDPLLTAGRRNYWKSHDLLELDDGLIDVLTSAAEELPDPETEIAFAQLGGAVSRVPAEATAYAHREARYVLNVHGRWEHPAKDAACIGWVRGLFEAAAPFATGGVYVNFLTADEGERVRAAYGRNWERLAAAKRRYDPANRFRVNQNIRPAD